MKNTIYLNEYEFLFEREIADFYNMKSSSNRYTSDIYLENLERNRSNLEKNYEFLKLLEKNIEIIVNGNKIGKMEKISFEIFSSLEIYLDKKNYFCKILNMDELNKRANIIKTFYMERNQDNRYTKILQDIEKYKMIIQNEQLLFNSINDNKFIKCLFCSPYYRKFEFSFKNIGFYITDFLEDATIPVKISEKIEKDYVEISGEIDETKMSVFSFKETLDRIFKEKIEEYQFSYNLKIHYKNKKIKDVNEKTSLRINDKLRLSETTKITGILEKEQSQ